MSASSRWLYLTIGLIGTSGPAALLVRRRYGRAARRFGLGMGSALLAQQMLVWLAISKSERQEMSASRHELSLVDLMTLSRGLAASVLAGLIVSGIRDRRGAAGWMGWLALLYGAILCDWLDGPIARRHGTSEVGVILDLEAGSWLTLCAAGAAVSWGAVPPTVAIPPLLRYILLFAGLRTMPYADFHRDDPRWVR